MNTWAVYFYNNHRDEASELETKVVMWTKFFHEMNEEVAELIARKSQETMLWVENNEKCHNPSKQYYFFQYMINFINELQVISESQKHIIK